MKQIEAVIATLERQYRPVYGPGRRHKIPRMSRMWWHLRGLYEFYRFRRRR